MMHNGSCIYATRTSEVICWFGSLLCRIDLQQDFESCYKLNMGAPLFSSWIFSQKKIGQMFYMLGLSRSCSNGAGSASRVTCENIIFILLWTHFEDCSTSMLNVQIVMSVFGNFTRNITNLPKGLKRAIASWATYYLDPATLSNMIERLWGISTVASRMILLLFLARVQQIMLIH
jgi:hypothetical protein